MKTMKVILLAVFAAIFAVACNPIQNGLTGYNEMVDAWEGATGAIADFGACVDSNTNMVITLTTQAQSYNMAQGGIAEQLAKILAAGETAKATVAETQNQVNSDPVAAATGGVNKIGGAFNNLMLTIPSIDSEVTRDLMAYTSEAYRSMNLCAANWNEAVTTYNSLRNKAGNELIAQISQKLGYELPERLERYTGSGNMTIGNALATPVPQ